MFNCPSIRTSFFRMLGEYPWRRLLSFAILTDYVENTTGPRLPEAAFPRHHPGLRLHPRSDRSRAPPPRGPARLRVPRRDDGPDARGNLDRAHPARRLDSGRDAARHHHVRPRLHADHLPEAAAGPASPAGLSGAERVAPHEGAHPARLSI